MENRQSLMSQLIGIFSHGFKSVPPALKSLLVVVIVFFTMIMIFLMTFRVEVKEIFEEQPLTVKEAEIMLDNERMMQRLRDSIEEANAIKRLKKVAKYRGEIDDESTKYKYLILNNCIGVNYYSIHNGGSPLEMNGNWELDVYVSTESSIEEDYSEDGGNPKLYKGWENINLKAVTTETSVYVPDVTKESMVYFGMSKEYLKQGNIKSFIILMVESRKNEALFVSFNFDVVDPHLKNENLTKSVYDFKRFVKSRI